MSLSDSIVDEKRPQSTAPSTSENENLHTLSKSSDGINPKDKEKLVGTPTDSDFSIDQRTTGSLAHKNLDGKNLDDKEMSQPPRSVPTDMDVSIVLETDDTSLPVDTFRAWTIGLSFSLFGAFVNDFFAERLPHIALSPFVAQLLSYPAGKLMEKTLPTRLWKLPLLGSFSLNPGPFSSKEHMLINIFSTVSLGPAGLSSIVLLLRLPMFYNQQWAASYAYQLLLYVSVNFLGLGLAGLTRQWLVTPRKAIWPHNLAVVALNNSFHDNSNNSVEGPLRRKWTIPRLRFFHIIFGFNLVYYLIPNFFATSLSLMNWPTWIAPKNGVLAAITGSITGLGINPLPTLDPNIIMNHEPMIVPFAVTLNLFLGTVFAGLVCIPLIYFRNIWYTAHLPINANTMFDNLGQRYNVRRIIKGIERNTAGYEAYSPVYLSASNAFKYGASFAIYPATIVHAYLYHGTEIAEAFRTITKRKQKEETDVKDVHEELMAHYPQIPHWWFLTVMAVSFLLAVVMIIAFPAAGGPSLIWSLLFSLGLGALFIIPIGLIASVSNVSISLGPLSEIISGLTMAGHPVSVMMFNSYGFIVIARGLQFVADLKLGHYAKLPPRSVFRAQLIGLGLSTFMSIAVVNYQVDNIKNLCMPNQPEKFVCPGANSIFTSTIIWGLIGPAKFFWKGSPYSGMLWGALVGVILPIGPYLYTRRYPASPVRHFHVVIFLFGTMHWAPQNISYVWLSVPVAYVSQIYIRTRYPDWYKKYNYLAAIGISVGIAFGAIFVYVCLQRPGIKIDWLLNRIGTDDCDATGKCPYRRIPEGGFGPTVGNFSF